MNSSVKGRPKRYSEFVVLFSSASAASDWVQTEIGVAWVLDKRIVVLLDKVSRDEVPEVVRNIKAFDLNDRERYLQELQARVEETLG